MSKCFKLYATIKENAGFQCPKSWRGSDKKYNHALYLLRGKEVKIETKYLFLNQLNTVPIKGVSKHGLRLNFNDIQSLRIENRTFRTIKMRIKKFYRDSWNEEITDKNLIAWKHLLGID
jgi:hypothetical protein